MMLVPKRSKVLEVTALPETVIAVQGLGVERRWGVGWFPLEKQFTFV